MKIFFTLTLALLLASPMAASAYTTSNQDVQQINNTTAIYSITYSFGHGKYDLYLPILAVRDQEHNTQAKTLGYEVLDNDELSSSNGETVALAASTAQIVDGMYFIPKGTAETFTFYTILSTEADAEKDRYAIQVTDLPFYRGDERAKMQLNVSELRYYVTPESTFNK